MQVGTSPWKTRLSERAIARLTRSGEWSNITLLDNAADKAERIGDEVAIVEGATSRTFCEILREAARLASWFRTVGLVPGDVVSFQLPNWSEAGTINLAACICGLVVNPIVPIYRDAEVGYILKNSRTKVFFIPEAFRSIDYVAMMDKLWPSLPDLRSIVVVRSSARRDRFADYSELTGVGPYAGGDIGNLQQLRVDPNAVKMLLYTSGTTGRPKGVLHSHNTIQAELDAVRSFWGLGEHDVVLMASPVTHITGYIYGLEATFAVGCKTVYMDKWDADRAVDLISDHGVTFSIGATPFLLELVAALERRGMSCPSLRLFACGGAPVAPELVKRARAVLPNCLTFRVYGSSEAPTVTAGVGPGDPAELGATTDGFILNYDVKIVSIASGEPVTDEAEGEILVRGPELMLGYTEWEDTVNSFDEEGYFKTGDIGFISHQNYITITGRKKDLIIRGGENISAKEVEDILHTYPPISEAAVVAMPHERMGETPVAYVVLQHGASIDFGELKSFLDDARLAKQKFPERLFIVDEMPRTASGKIRKDVLRARAAEAAAQDECRSSDR